MITAKYHSGDISKLSFLITGGAGFIGSHIVDYLLFHGAYVRVLDNFSTGNLSNIQSHLQNKNLEVIEGDISDPGICKKACENMDYVLHQAALGSVPRSIDNPIATHNANVNGFLNILTSAKETSVRKVVYASSSSVYGDSPALPKKEEVIGKPLSPYAVTKLVDELYARVFCDVYKMKITGLRYFNIFGPRQNPRGQYAAAIPIFIQAALDSKSVTVYGDGEQTRDFTFVANAVKANILAVFSDVHNAEVYNIAAGTRISLNEVLKYISECSGSKIKVDYKEPRTGDVKDSHADISKAKDHLNYTPEVSVQDGLIKTFHWFKSETTSE